MMIDLEIKNKIQEKVTSLGFYFVDLKIVRSKKEVVFEIYVDSDTGINISDCQKISKELSAYFDTLDYVNYRLNVSSPGIGYPIIYDWQFKKTLLRNVEVKFNNDGKVEKVKGKLIAFNPMEITLNLTNGKELHINRSNINIIREII